MGGYGIVGGNLPLAAGPRARLRLQGRGLGHRLHVRRRRLEHRQLRRDDEHRGALETPRRLPGREQPLRDGHVDRAPLRRHRPLAQGRGLRGPGRAGRRDGRACHARGGRRAPAHRPRGAAPDAARSVHLPLSRPLRRRPRDLPREGGGRGVAREGPDREPLRSDWSRRESSATRSWRRFAPNRRAGGSGGRVR